MNNQETRFFKELEIPLFPWHKNGPIIYDGDNKALLVPINDYGVPIICLVPELFLSSFKLVYRLTPQFGDHFPQTAAECVEQLLSSQATCQTWQELCRLWEECAE